MPVRSIAVEVNFDIGCYTPDEEGRLREKIITAVQYILKEAEIIQASFEIDVLGDEAIHQVNVDFLGHDYATDVLAFEMDRDDSRSMLEGNILVSAETAASRATEFGWSAEEELLLYVIHGTLHLVGYDDHEGGDADLMRVKENEALAVIGIVRPSK